MYSEVDYARTRLEGTVVLHDNKALRINHITSDRVIQGTLLQGREVEVSMDDCQLAQHKLGFVNRDGNVFYVQRLPKRRDWRQGLRTNNVVGFRIGRDRIERISDTTIMKCLEGNFPSVADALDEVVRCDVPVAISRSFALVPKRGGICVQYKQRGIVGVYRDGEFVLSDKYKYLKPALVKEGVWLTQ